MTTIITTTGVALLFLLVDMSIGRRWERARRHPAADKDPTEPVCGCTHHKAMHHPETGKCNAYRMQQATEVMNSGYPVTRSERLGCACLQYIGPEPLTLPGMATGHPTRLVYPSGSETN